MIITIVIALLLANQSLQQVQSQPVDVVANLKALCSGQPVDQLTAGQVRSYTARLQQIRMPECPQNTRAAIIRMGTILAANSHDVCTMNNALAIKSFYDTYLGDEAKSGKVPEALEAFALTYALQVSRACKFHAIKVFTNETDNSLRPEDHEALAKWTAKDGDIGRLLSTIAEPGALVIPSDLAAILPDDQTIGHLVVKSSSPTVDADIKHIKRICLSRFEPVYNPVVDPIAYLSRAGFDYSDKVVRAEIKADQEVAEKLEEWARIVFLCETMDLVRSFKKVAADDEVGEQDVIFWDAYESFEEPIEEYDRDGEDQEIYKEAKGTIRELVSMKEVEPLPVEQLDKLREQLRAHTNDVDRFKANLRRGSEQIVQSVLGKKMFDESELKVSSRDGERRLLGSAVQRNDRQPLSWEQIIMKLGLSAVILAAMVKMPMTP